MPIYVDGRCVEAQLSFNVTRVVAVLFLGLRFARRNVSFKVLITFDVPSVRVAVFVRFFEWSDPL